MDGGIKQLEALYNGFLALAVPFAMGARASDTGADCSASVCQGRAAAEDGRAIRVVLVARTLPAALDDLQAKQGGVKR